jgi:PPK2 family polyphosphate:nucleotide phosphotransferase
MYAHRIDGSRPVKLADVDPNADGGLSKEEGLARIQELGAELAELEDLLYFAGQQSLLIILQGRDTSGKDGAIRAILDYSNAQGTRVASFKVPTEEELAHDFLWRVHRETPGRGGITIFNRSHYEDVLVVRVHKLVPESVWRARYEHIRHFEKLLTDSHTLLLKFYLHIDRDEQEQRLLDREKETEKAWKLSVGDWKEREHWDAYTAAYEEALERCSTEHAPWHVVPANRKWFRTLAILERIVAALRPHREGWLEKLEKIGAAAKEELEAYRAERPA